MPITIPWPEDMPQEERRRREVERESERRAREVAHASEVKAAIASHDVLALCRLAQERVAQACDSAQPLRLRSLLELRDLLDPLTVEATMRTLARAGMTTLANVIRLKAQDLSGLYSSGRLEKLFGVASHEIGELAIAANAAARLAAQEAVTRAATVTDTSSAPASPGSGSTATSPAEPVEAIPVAGNDARARDGDQVQQPVATSPAFFRDGDGWTVEFDGKRAVVKHVVGMALIQKLLMQPDVPLDLAQLDRLDSGIQDSEQRVADVDAVRAIRTRLNEIASRLRDQEESLSTEEREDLLEEQKTLSLELRSTYAQGRPRTMKSPRNAAVDRTRASIRRALQAIRKQHKTLGQHLDRSLLSAGGSNPCYRPKPSITWRVNA